MASMLTWVSLLFEDDSCEEEDCGIHAYPGEPSCLGMTLVRKKIVASMLTG